MKQGTAPNIDLHVPSSRKERGAFFTPPELADKLAAWAIRHASEKVLEPACGEAVFLLSALERLQELGASPVQASGQVTGCELHRESAQRALGRCRRLSFEPVIHVGDFLFEAPRADFDAVIGNPPYIRFQLIKGPQKDAIREISYRNGMSLSAMASAWAPFVIHSTAFLKDGGRLALVLPAELMTVNYAASIRSFLMESYSSITLVTFDKQVFPEVQEEVVLLLAQGCRQGRTDHIEWRQCGTIADFPGAHSKEFYPQPNGEKWTKGLADTPAVDLLSSCEADGFCRLGDWGSISLGTVTGNNSFFAVSKATAEHWHLDDGDTLPLSPPGSRHLRGVSLTPAKMSELSEAGKQVLLFYPDPSKPPSKAAEAYIEHGVELGVPKGYKCRNRSPWWKVPLSGKPDIFITYMNDYAPSLCSNLAGAYCLNSVHGLRLHAEFRQIGRAFLPLACMNSATLLSSEIEGRAYGGGILKVEPREAANLLVPSPSLLSACLPELDRIAREEGALLGSGKISEACDIVDAVLAGHVGSLGESGFEALRDEKDRLYGRRKARARKA